MKEIIVTVAGVILAIAIGISYVKMGNSIDVLQTGVNSKIESVVSVFDGTQH